MVEKAELTQVEIAARIGMTQPAVSRMLKGMTRNISVDKLFSVMLALGHEIEITADETPKDSARLQDTQRKLQDLIAI